MKPKPELAPDLTPMTARYARIKKAIPGNENTLLLIQLGDFCEAFFDDAKWLADICKLALTNRHGVPMCGFPTHAINTYAAKIIIFGRRVALYDGLSDNPSEQSLHLKFDSNGNIIIPEPK